MLGAECTRYIAHWYGREWRYVTGEHRDADQSTDGWSSQRVQLRAWHRELERIRWVHHFLYQSRDSFLWNKIVTAPRIHRWIQITIEFGCDRSLNSPLPEQYSCFLNETTHPCAPSRCIVSPTVVLFQFDDMFFVVLAEIQCSQIFINIVHTLSTSKGVDALIIIAHGHATVVNHVLLVVFVHHQFQPIHLQGGCILKFVDE